MATRQTARSRSRGAASEEAPSDATLPQKKRARQRFVGALALCLIAAASIPWVLAPEPSRTSSELDLLMPSRHMPGPAGQAAKEAVSEEIGVLESGGTAKAIATLDTEGTPAPEASRPEAAAVPPAPAPEAAAEPPAAAAPEPAAAPALPAVMPRASGGSESRLAERAESKSNSPMPARPRAADAGRGRHAVQVGAYATESAAKTAVERVQRMGLRAFTERIKTDRGERIRVRVGPYASREAAEVARSKLKAEGIDAAVIAP